MATKSAFIDQILQPNKDDDWQNLGAAKVRAGDPGVTYVKPNRIESILNPKKTDPFEQMMRFMIMHRMMQGGGTQMGMPELMLMGSLPKTGAETLPSTLGEMVGKSPDDYASRLLKQLTPEHYRAAGYGTNKQDDVIKNLVESIIPNELMARHALQVGGGKQQLGAAILDAYLRENPSSSGLGLKSILKQQLGPHLTGITNQQAAENLNTGLDGLTQSPQKKAPSFDDLLSMVSEHVQKTQMMPATNPAEAGKVARYVSAYDNMKVAVVAPSARPTPPVVSSRPSMGPLAATLGGAGLLGAGAGASYLGAFNDPSHVADNASGALSGLTDTALNIGKGLGGTAVGMGAGVLDFASAHPVLGLLGALGLGGGLTALMRGRKGQDPSEIARLSPNKFLDEKGRWAQFDPESFESVVGRDPSFGRFARGLNPQTIADIEKHTNRGGMSSFFDRLLGGGRRQDAAQQALQNIAYSTGGGSADPLKHLQTITGLGRAQLGPALSRMLMAARAPQTGGAFTQAMGDQQGLGGMKINPQDPMSQMALLSMLR